MKRSERHRLKENAVTHALTEATARLAERRKTFGLAGIVALLIVLAGVGYWAWQTRQETQAQVILTDALMVVQSPVEDPKPGASGKAEQAPGSFPTINARAEASLAKFTQVANAYPSTKSGIAGRYHAAAALMMLGRAAEAATRFQEVIDRMGTKDFYGRMSQLGVLEARVQAKQFDQAISTAQALTISTDEHLPRDAMLMELGRIYLAAGKKSEAKQTFDRVLTEFPESAYADEARQLIATS